MTMVMMKGRAAQTLWHGTCTREIPAMRMSSENHWETPNFVPSMETENKAVVRIFSWYVT